MYELADKYDVVGLKDLVQKKFKYGCTQYWYSESFSVAANHAFLTSPPKDKALCDIVSDTIADHLELIHNPKVQALMNEFNGLSLGIMLRKADEYSWGKQ
jgi:hypothetical protein